MKRMEVGVRKVEMWEDENWSIRFRYLIHNDHPSWVSNHRQIIASSMSLPRGDVTKEEGWMEVGGWKEKERERGEEGTWHPSPTAAHRRYPNCCAQ